MSNQTFKPAWWLSSPHLQTLFPTLARKVKPVSHYQRERLTTPDNDFIDIDWCNKESNQPLVVLLHGLAGSSQSSYILGLQHVFYQQGFKSVALNFRGCSGKPNNLAKGYHSGETGDINFLYQTLRQREPETSMAIVGFSLGGNVLLKWLGEQENNITLTCAVAVSVPLQLGICATKLDQGFSKIYRNHLISHLINYIQNKHDHLKSKGFHKEAKKIADLGDLSSIKSFWEYDNKIVAKLHQFKDVHDYYQRSSSRQFLKIIRIPTKIIQAADDPFMTKEILPSQSELSDAVQFELLNTGGHVGFISGHIPFKPNYWLEQTISDYLKKQGLAV